MKNKQLEEDSEKFSIDYFVEKKKIDGMLNKLKDDSYRKNEFNSADGGLTPTYLEALKSKRLELKVKLSWLENDIIKLNNFKQSALVIWTMVITVLIAASPGIIALGKEIFMQIYGIPVVPNGWIAILLTVYWFVLVIGSFFMVVALIAIFGEVTGIWDLRFGVVNFNKTQQNILEQNICKLTIEVVNELIENEDKGNNNCDNTIKNIVIKEKIIKEMVSSFQKS